MSKIRDIHDSMVTLFQSTLPTYVQLFDSLDTDSNTHLDLEKGFSFTFGTAENAQDNFCKGDIRIQRVITLVMTNLYVPNYDVSFRKDTELDFMDDHTAILKAFECEPTIFQNAIRVEYASDSGLAYLQEDQKHFIVITTDFNVDYIEGI